jgi:hypothetical protein
MFHAKIHNDLKSTTYHLFMLQKNFFVKFFDTKMAFLQSQASARQVQDDQLEALQPGPEGVRRADDLAGPWPSVVRYDQRQARISATKRC